jgi:TusA-related sulfurtransferase
MTAGERLAIVTDDPRAERDIPLAAESEGWAVIEIARRGGALTIVIER